MAATTDARPRFEHDLLDKWAPRIDDPFTLFSFLMAFGVLNHSHTLKGLAPSYANVGSWVFLAAASALLIAPSSRRLFMLMTGGIAVDVLFQMPFVVNHWLAFGVLTLAGAGLAVRSLAIADRGMRDRFLTVGWMALGATTIISVWAFAVLHKLNRGFFDAVHSCAVSHTNDITDLLGFGRPVGGGLLGWVLILAAIGAEIGVPVLLVVKRWRLAGLVLAFGFHMVMGFNGHQAFSGLALALYVPFLPATIWDQFRAPDIWQRLAWRFTQLAGLGLAALGLLLTVIGRDYNLIWRKRVLFLVAATLLATAIYKAWRNSGSAIVADSTLNAEMATVDAGLRRTIWVIASVVVAVMTLNGITPYLGVKSQLTISMYSNIRVETADTWNHLFIPEQVRVLGSDDDLIDMVDIGHEQLAEQFEGTRVDSFEIRRVVSQTCASVPISATYRIGNSESLTSVPDICETDLAAEPSFLERKLLRFRDVVEPNFCQW